MKFRMIKYALILLISFALGGCQSLSLNLFTTPTPFPTYTYYPTFTPVPDLWSVEVLSVRKGPSFGGWAYAPSDNYEFLIVTL